MKRSKMIFAAVMIGLSLSALCVPCFAEVSSEYNWSIYGSGAPPIDVPLSGYTASQKTATLTIADNAFDLGLFGGGRPVALLQSISNGTYQTVAAVLPATYSNGFTNPVDFGPEDDKIRFYFFNTTTQVGLALYTLNERGQWGVRAIADFVSTSTYKVMALWRDGNWVTGGTDSYWATDILVGGGGTVEEKTMGVLGIYEAFLEAPNEIDPDVVDRAYNEGYTAGFYAGEEVWWQGGYDIGYLEGYDLGYLEGYNDGVDIDNPPDYQLGYTEGYNEGYGIGYNDGAEEGYQEGLLDGSPNTIDIAYVFDGIAGSVRSIFSAFDIELFGISIAGTLLAVLVIGIVAFIVRRLMK